MASETIAIVTIKKASQFTRKGKKEVAAWLRRTADSLEKDGDQYADLMRCHYLHDDKLGEKAVEVTP